MAVAPPGQRASSPADRFAGVKQQVAELAVQAQTVARDLFDSLLGRGRELGAEIARDALTDIQRQRLLRTAYALADDDEERRAVLAFTAHELADEGLEDADRFAEAEANAGRAQEALELDRAVHELAGETCGPQCCRGSSPA